MTPDQTPLVNKLTLLVLCLILVCLVLLVGRAYQNTRLAVETAVAEAEAAPAAVEETWPAPPPPQTRPPQPPRRPSTTNAPRASLPARAPLPAAGTVSGEAAPGPAQYTEVPTALVNVSEVEYANRPSAVISSSGTSLFGWVMLTGTPKPEIPIDLGPTCSALNTRKVTTRHFVVSPGGHLANVLVYVSNARSGPPLVDPPLLDQIGCMFEPYVLGVVTGQKFKIRNSDPTLHNIHATPKVNREFNFAQASGGQVNERSFPKPELFIRLKCDVHPWMFAYVNVLDHPFFAITDTNGVFRLPGALPAGDYTVSAVHLKAGELTQRVTIGDGEPRPIHFQFSAVPGAQPQGAVARTN